MHVSRKFKDRQLFLVSRSQTLESLATRDSCSTVSSSSSYGSTTDAKGACSASTTSSDCESRPIVCLLERLRAPTASELGRKRKIDANPAHPKGKKCSTRRTVRICSVFSLFS